MVKSIFCKKGDLYIKIDRDNICYAVVEGDYISITLKNKETIQLRDSLTQMEKSINSDCFFRTHRSWLVNLDRVDCLDSKGEWLEIEGKKIPVSRSRRGTVKK